MFGIEVLLFCFGCFKIVFFGGILEFEGIEFWLIVRDGIREWVVIEVVSGGDRRKFWVMSGGGRRVVSGEFKRVRWVVEIRGWGEWWR